MEGKRRTFVPIIFLYVPVAEILMSQSARRKATMHNTKDTANLSSHLLQRHLNAHA